MSSLFQEPKIKVEFQLGSRVVVIDKGRKHFNRTGNVIRILENPSHLSKYQWYDVKFEGPEIGRFRSFELTNALTVKDSKVSRH